MKLLKILESLNLNESFFSRKPIHYGNDLEMEDVLDKLKRNPNKDYLKQLFNKIVHAKIDSVWDEDDYYTAAQQWKDSGDDNKFISRMISYIEKYLN